MKEAARANFAEQAQWCRQLGSPFTALLCETVASHLADDCAVGRRVLGWSGNAGADALALRLCGALNALVRAGQTPALALLYPPHPLPEPVLLWREVRRVLEDHESAILSALDSAPQTNEVARSAVLLGGFLTIAAETGKALSLLELGASGGLNLNWERYGYRLGTTCWGEASSPVQLECDWRGAPPPLQARIAIARRAGCDRNPLDPSLAEDRARLLAYVWPDQSQRIARLEGALALAQAMRTSVERIDAAQFSARELARPHDGTARILYHSVVWQYLPQDTRSAIDASVAQAARSATSNYPLAWLAFEMDGDKRGGALTLQLWPKGEKRLLARADFHGRWVEWL